MYGLVLLSSCIIWFCLLWIISFKGNSLHVNAHGYQTQGYMFLVKSCYQIKIGVDDYIVVDLCVIKVGLIIV